jgi:hypothetical protein
MAIDLGVISQYALSLIPLLLSVSISDKSAKVRICALECLEKLTELPFHVVYPCKDDTLRSLGLSIGDSKKAVRAVARRCRNKWFILGESI